MKKSLFLAIIAISTVLMSNAFADESWSCNYKGSWLRAKDKKSDNFNWTVKWLLKRGKWSIVGDNTDSYGLSWFDGNCADQKCDFTQSYQSGKLKGKKYYYTGKFTNKSMSTTQTINTMGGTWGYETFIGGGTWTATGVCSKD